MGSIIYKKFRLSRLRLVIFKVVRLKHGDKVEILTPELLDPTVAQQIVCRLPIIFLKINKGTPS
jgi:hypothetical protein